MELLPQGAENNIQVTFDDQQQINKFSTLMTNFDRLNDRLKFLNTEKELIDDVSLELELIDEDELVNYLIGGEVSSTVANESSSAIIGDGCFVNLKQSKVMELLEAKAEKIDSEISETDAKINEIEKTLSSLKSSLYAKFGKAINLEK